MQVFSEILVANLIVWGENGSPLYEELSLHKFALELFLNSYKNCLLKIQEAFEIETKSL